MAYVTEQELTSNYQNRVWDGEMHHELVMRLYGRLEIQRLVTNKTAIWR